jgi:hypothetical protein
MLVASFSIKADQSCTFVSWSSLDVAESLGGKQIIYSGLFVSGTNDIPDPKAEALNVDLHKVELHTIAVECGQIVANAQEMAVEVAFTMP